MTMNWDDWEKQYLGGGGTPTTTTAPKPATTYAQSALQDKQTTLAGQPGIKTLAELQASNGARYLNANTIGLADGSKYQLRGDGSGLWGAGFNMTKAEQPLYRAGAPVGGGQPAQGTIANQPANQPIVSPGARSSLLGPADFTSLTGGAGVTVPVPGSFIQPGGISQAGRTDLYGPRGNTDLNTIYGGRQGSAVQIPVTPGFRGEGQTGNSIAFASGASGGGRVEPQMLFPGVNVNVPDTYVMNQGNVGDSNRAYDVPFNIGPAGAGIASIAGNNVQIQGAPGSGVGYGYALNAMPASSVFAATGRSPSDDPATQAMQSLQLQAALNQMGGGAGAIQALTAANANQFGGYHAGTGNDPFSGNGGSAQGIWPGFSAPVAPAAAPLLSPAAGPTALLNPGSAGNAGAGLTDVRQPYDTTPAGGVPARAPGAFGPPAPAAGGIIGSTASATLPGATPNGDLASKIEAARAALAAAQEDKDRQAGGGSTTSGPGFGEGPSYMAGGGTVSARPLGGRGTDLVTNEPIDGFGRFSGKHLLTVGEDNTDPDSLPNSELLRGVGSPQLQVIPLQPARMATGGSVTIDPGGQVVRPPAPTGIPQVMIPWAPQIPMLAPSPWGRYTREQVEEMQRQAQMQGGGPRRMATGGEVNYMPPPAPATVPIDNGVVNVTPPPAAPAVPPVVDDPFGDLLPPWQQAAQTLAGEQANRNRLQYRRRAGGLGAEVGVPVLQGQAEGRLLPGQYFDYQPQVNNMISDILSNRSQYQTLGPAEDVNPLYGRVGDIGVGLDRFQRVRGLEGQLPGLLATNELNQQKARQELAVNQAQYGAAQQGLATANQIAAQYYSANLPGANPTEENQMLLAQYNAQAKVDAINAAIQEATAAANGLSPALVSLNAQLEAERAALGDTNEAGLRTELALLNQRLSNQTKRVQLQNVATNLKAAGVPSLSAPLAV